MGDANMLAIAIFVFFVLAVLVLSFYFARRAKSASGYYAAGGQIHWGVNGIAFAGDYLSAASFLGICGMIATAGYDGFLYSIGYLAGWIVALFVVAEPMKRMGKYTFTDALDSTFDSKGIKLAAAISTLIVSICYLIPQMVGAGVLVEPLLGMKHYWGVIMVGAIVITIVATAGMTSTTYVQFLKGGLLIVFSTVLVIALLMRGFSTEPDQGGDVPFYEYQTVTRSALIDQGLTLKDYQVKDSQKKDKTFVRAFGDSTTTWWAAKGDELHEVQWKVARPDGSVVINGQLESEGAALRQVGNLVSVAGKTGEEAKTGPVGPAKFLAIMADKDTLVQRWKSASFEDGSDSVQLHYPVITQIGRAHV
jgi:cation/acetate symporter